MNQPSPPSTNTTDALSSIAMEIRARLSYVSARDELNDPDSVINTAEAGEPVFVLRARDNVAHMTIDWWLWCARNRGVPAEKLIRAERQLKAVEMWLDKHVPSSTQGPGQPVVRTAQSERSDPKSVLNTAHPDEPVFVIVGSDAVATEVVEFWSYMAERNGAPAAKVGSAMEVAKAMARWSEKRLVGSSKRDAISMGKAKPARQAMASSSDPFTVNRKHATHSKIVCLQCGYEEKIGEPPYTEDLLAAIAEACKGPCPSCGAMAEIDATGGLERRPLTTKMVAPD